MKLVNRGFLIVRPTEAFLSWANLNGQGIAFTSDDNPEPSIYLIEEDFFDIEPIIERHFKAMFEQELELVNEDESTWPQNRTIELFLMWFEIEAGTTVFDAEKSDLRTDV
jgi:hypothetical protein